jgi:DNA-binding XRE family transcriptional regulator
MNKLKRAREDAGMSIIGLADKLGMEAAAYRRYERDEVSPKISLCLEICRHLDLTLAEVFDQDYVPPKAVDISYRAKPGQTIYIKIEIDQEK